MTNRDIIIKLSAETCGISEAKARARYEQLLAAYPDFEDGTRLGEPADPELYEELRQEKPGIALWALAGFAKQSQDR
jgi:hypothetical protein